jgi:hypothetical protein
MASKSIFGVAIFGAVVFSMGVSPGRNVAMHKS